VKNLIKFWEKYTKAINFITENFFGVVLLLIWSAFLPWLAAWIASSFVVGYFGSTASMAVGIAVFALLFPASVWNILNRSPEEDEDDADYPE
jgi:hypothetical protein